ncbi:MAG: helix-turn-helix domain-containing protein [Neisseriaceae bacterium]|nr:helix-turn-helix domain-containing protein [Neisseriaceae bacterium]
MKTYTIRQAAEICHCHHSTILEYIHSGSLLACKIGRKWVITEENLDNFIKTRHNLTVQAVNSKQSRRQCYTNEAINGTPISQQQVARELDALLAQPTNSQRKNYTTNSNISNGELTVSAKSQSIRGTRRVSVG